MTDWGGGRADVDAFSALLFASSDSIAGAVTLAFGAAPFLGALVAWLVKLAREQAEAVRTERSEKRPAVGIWAVALFIPSEIVLFASLYAVYFTLGNHAADVGATFFTSDVMSAQAILLTYVLIGSFFGQVSATRHTVLTSIGIYWHFVDLVWISLFLIVYLRLV